MANTSSPTRTSSTGSPPAWPSREPLGAASPGLPASRRLPVSALSPISDSETPCVRSGPLSCCSPLMPGLLSRACGRPSPHLPHLTAHCRSYSRAAPWGWPGGGRRLPAAQRRPPQEEPERGREQQQRERHEPLGAEGRHGRDRRLLGRAPCPVPS